MSDILDFGWGNPYFLLEILDDMYIQTAFPNNILDMSYAPDAGTEELINTIKKTINQTTGMDYKHIIVTTGTTQAINVLLRVLKSKTPLNDIRTTKLGYPFYDKMIEKAGLNRVEMSRNELLNNSELPCIEIIDSPSNPLGEQYGSSFGSEKLTIWDAVYHNKIYTNDLFNKPKHVAMVNSYSKLLGLTGARIGYIATNDDLLYNRCLEDSLMENATISIPSQELIVDILNQVNLDNFINKGKQSLNRNKEEFKKIEYLFSNQRVQETGMFYCAEGDDKLCKLLDNCGIKYVRLKDNLIRLSMGQTNLLTRQAIDRILKRDKNG